MRLAVICALAGCYTAAPASAPIANRAAPASSGLLTITENSFGPLRAGSPATLAALRAAFSGYDVRATNDSSLSYSVYRGDEKLVWVIPADDGTIFNVHATSPRVETRGRDWRVGSALQGARYFTHCECWGENPTCFREGDHIAVNVQRGCDGTELPQRIDGAVVQRVIWSPTPFRADADEP